jgi:hypothetical protein
VLLEEGVELLHGDGHLVRAFHRVIEIELLFINPFTHFPFRRDFNFPRSAKGHTLLQAAHLLRGCASRLLLSRDAIIRFIRSRAYEGLIN